MSQGLSQRLEQKLHQRIRGAGTHKVDAPKFEFSLDPNLLQALARTPTPAPPSDSNSNGDDYNDYAVESTSASEPDAEPEQEPEEEGENKPTPRPVRAAAPSARRSSRKTPPSPATARRSPRQTQTTTTAAVPTAMGPPAKLNAEREQKLRQRMRGAGTHKVATPVSSFMLDGALLQTPDTIVREREAANAANKTERTPEEEASQRRRSRLSGSGEGRKQAVAAVTPVARGKRIRQPSPERIATPTDEAPLSVKRRKVDSDVMRQVLMEQEASETRDDEEEEEQEEEEEDEAELEIGDGEKEEDQGEDEEETPRRLLDLEPISSSPSARVLNRRGARTSRQMAMADESEIIEILDDEAEPAEETRDEEADPTMDDISMLDVTAASIGDADTTHQGDLTGALDESTVMVENEPGRLPDITDILDGDDTSILQPLQESSKEQSVLSEIREPNKVAPQRQPGKDQGKAPKKPLPKGPAARRKLAEASSSSSSKPTKPSKAHQRAPSEDEAPKKKRRPKGEPVPVTIRQLPGAKTSANAADVLSTFVSEIFSQTKHRRSKPENGAVEEYTAELQARLLQISDLMTLQARQAAEYRQLVRERKSGLAELLGLREQRERIGAEMEEVREAHERGEREEENRKIVQVWENVEQLIEKNKGRDMSGEVAGNVETELLLVTGSLGEHEKLQDWRRWAESIVKS